MTIINSSFKTGSGKNVAVNLVAENAGVTGNATINGQIYSVDGYATVQGKKVLRLTNAPAPYLPIINSLYEQIEAACKAQFNGQLTALQIAEGKMREAESKYNRLFAQGYNNQEIIRARNEWDQASAEYHKLAK